LPDHAEQSRTAAEPPQPQTARAAAGADRMAAALNRRAEAKLAEPARLLQRRAEVAAADARVPIREPGPRPNRTGLPDDLKAGVEALSGLSMDDVRVHRNSREPAKLGALAHASGNHIHLGPGQEAHLPHEAWHVVQQKQGRVRRTGTAPGGAPLNDDDALEAEADRLGRNAIAAASSPEAAPVRSEGAPPQERTIQLKGLAAILEEGTRPTGDTLVQLQLSAKLIDEYEAELEGDGDFIWYASGENQNRWMCHIHLFAIDSQEIRGQLTVRAKQSDKGGIELGEATDENIVAEVLRKYGKKEEGRENREAIVRDLKELVRLVMSKWNRIKDDL
jgi:hypothetical protein